MISQVVLVIWGLVPQRTKIENTINHILGKQFSNFLSQDSLTILEVINNPQFFKNVNLYLKYLYISIYLQYYKLSEEIKMLIIKNSNTVP